MSKTVLITGANKSIGFETARQLLKEGYHVFLGSRDLKNGQQAAEKLKAEGLNQVQAIQLDVTDQDSVNAARIEIGKITEVLDVLINNAGITGGFPQSALEAKPQQFMDVFQTNVIGVVRVTQAFIDLVRNSNEPRIVMVSSSQGSLTLANGPSNIYYNHKASVYQPSKSALNMYSTILAYELRDTSIKVNMVDPGFTETDFNGNRGTGTVEDAGKRIVKYAVLNNNGPTGKFISEEYNPETGECPW